MSVSVLWGFQKIKAAADDKSGYSCQIGWRIKKRIKKREELSFK